MRDIIDETINTFGSTTKSGDIASANKDGLGQCLSIMSKYLAKKMLVSSLDEDSNSHDQKEVRKMTAMKMIFSQSITKAVRHNLLVLLRRLWES